MNSIFWPAVAATALMFFPFVLAFSIMGSRSLLAFMFVPYSKWNPSVNDPKGNVWFGRLAIWKSMKPVMNSKNIPATLVSYTLFTRLLGIELELSWMKVILNSSTPA